MSLRTAKTLCVKKSFIEDVQCRAESHQLRKWDVKVATRVLNDIAKSHIIKKNIKQPPPIDI